MNMKVFLVLVAALSLATSDVVENSCQSKISCDECIQTLSCAWCMTPGTDAILTRCFNPYDEKPGCPEESTNNPDNVIVILSPQRKKIQLRMDESFRVGYAIAVKDTRIELKDNSTDAVKLTYHSACRSERPATKTNECDGLTNGDVVNFEMNIEFHHCPKDSSEWTQTIEIIGGAESVIIELEMICRCRCHDYEEKSTHCSGSGRYACGVCECDSSRFGRHCECDSDDGFYHEESCLINNTTTTECSGRGRCSCGICQCDRREDPREVIYGKFCECDNFSCDRSNDIVCSGPQQGTCMCGTCVCVGGWSGHACETSIP